MVGKGGARWKWMKIGDMVGDYNITHIGSKGIILTRDTDIWKQGDDIHQYKDLPEILNMEKLGTIFENIEFLDVPYVTDLDDKVAKLRPDGKIGRAIITREDIDIDNLYNSLRDNGVFLETFLNGPDKVPINTVVTYFLSSISSYNKFDKSNQFKSEWILPNGTKISSNSDSISFVTDNDTNLIGTSREIKGRLIDKFGNKSKYITKTITYDTNLSGYVKKSSSYVYNNSAPVIYNMTWNDDNHVAGSDYYLTVYFSEPDTDPVDLYVKCDHMDVDIRKMLGMPNVIHITYPAWTSVQTVQFTVTVLDIYGYKDTKTVNKIVSP